MSVDISVSITEDQVDIIATPTVNIVNVTNSASIDPGLYDLSEFTNTSLNPFVRTSGLSSYVPSTRSILTTSPLVGGGDLSANRTISIPQATSSVNGFLSSTDWTTFNNKQNALGFTPVPETRTITINGLAQDLSTDRSWTISTGLTVGTTPISSGTIGRVLFEGSGNVLQQSSSLAYDDTTKAFTLSGSIGSGSAVRNSVTNTSNSGFADFFAFNDTGRYVGVQIGGSAATGTFANISNANISKIVTNNPFVIGTQNTNPLIFAVGASVTTGEVARFSASTGNFLINTTTDAGFRLDVNGTARMQGNTTIGTTTTSQTVLNIFSSSRADFRLKTSGSSDNSFSVYAVGGAFGSNYAQFGTNDGENASQQGGAIYTDSRTGGAPPIRLMVKGTGTTAMTSAMSIFNTGNVGINTTTDAGFRLDVNGTARVRGTGTTSATTALTVQNSSSANLFQMRDDGVMLVRGGDAMRTGSVSSLYYLDLGRVVVRNGDASADSQMQIGSNLAPVASAVLDLNSSTRGFLPPRMTTTQKNAIASPAAGLVIFDVTLNKLCVFTTTWETVTSV